MYLSVLTLVAASIVTTSAFGDFCGKNVTLNKRLVMVLDSSMPDGVCRIVIRPSHSHMLMAAAFQMLDRYEATPEMCNNVKIIHRETTYNLCHPGSLPTLDQEFVVEVLKKSVRIRLWMTVFYPTQCQIDAEMCGSRNEERETCKIRTDQLHWDATYPQCTDQQARDCPHSCGVCSNGTAGSCCFNGGYQRDELGSNIWDSMRICSSHPYGCNYLECDETCDVGQANGPFCVATMAIPITVEPSMDYGGSVFGGASYDAGHVDGGSVDGGVGKEGGNTTKSGVNGVFGNWAVIAGITLVLNP